MENNIIALLTDFGNKDYFIGAMKGVMLSINENAKIIDITHEIPPQDVRAGSFTLNACYENFPPGTVFVAVVDPGVGSDRRAILVETENYYFITPDNGLLNFIFEREKNVRGFEITNKDFFHKPVSKTFHGRDVFAPSAAHLSKGVSPGEFGDSIEDYVFYKTNQPERTNEQEIEATIIHIDHFGNLITNLRKEDLPEDFHLLINDEKIESFHDFFAEAEEKELFMLVGSTGFLEVVANQDSAEKLLQAVVGEKVILRQSKSHF